MEFFFGYSNSEFIDDNSFHLLKDKKSDIRTLIKDRSIAVAAGQTIRIKQVITTPFSREYLFGIRTSPLKKIKNTPVSLGRTFLS